jgi:DNA-binding response OmpR family regulator
MDTIPAAKIIIVDDEPHIRFFLEKVLRNDGHAVVSAESGEEALKKIATEEFDLALLDLRLGTLSGMEVLSEIRRRSPDTAVIVLTGYASLETAVEALRQGAHDYLFKPCKTVELRESIRTGLLKRHREIRQRELLSQLERNLTNSLEEIRSTVVRPELAAPTAAPRSETSPASPALPPTEPKEDPSRFLQRGLLIVDMMRHLITCDGHLLELSPTEFNLLAYLINESPRVVSPQELVREIQGYESDPWEARDLIRYHIYHIRQRIQTATQRTDIITTIRGVGYTINCG